MNEQPPTTSSILLREHLNKGFAQQSLSLLKEDLHPKLFKVCWILWACKLKMDVSMVQKNFGWLSR
ncbi:hypothetical protein LEMLEM_LOCUS9868, partial [Lemmus lemmus]